MVSDYYEVLSRFYRSVGLRRSSTPESHLSFKDDIKDGKVLMKFVRSQYPNCIWSEYSFEDDLFNDVFVFVKICGDFGVPRDLLPDASDILLGENTDKVLQSIDYLMNSASHSEVSVDHSGPSTGLSDSIGSCTCLQCRWKKALHVVLTESHPWSSNRILPVSFKRLIEEGIPYPVREHVWLYLSGGLNLIRSRRPEYAHLVSIALTDSKYIEQIDLDISRTFNDMDEWREKRYDVITRRVLACYSVRNESIGYCQGLSYIVGTLVTVVNEESAFVILCAMIEDGLLPMDYYTNLQGALVDQAVVGALLKKLIPGLVDWLMHEDGLDQFAVQLTDYTFSCIPWHMCLFSSTFTRLSVIRLWDFLFAFGPCVLFRTTLSLWHELFQKLAVSPFSPSQIRIQLAMIEDSIKPSDIPIFACYQFQECDNETVSRLRRENTAAHTSNAPPLTVIDLFNSDGGREKLTVKICSDESHFGSYSPPLGRVGGSEKRRAAQGVLVGLSDFFEGRTVTRKSLNSSTITSKFKSV